ncbi:fluoride efflux transporter CrcB [Bacillus sp. 03113]|uniref:fluoride efflux transporter CrcB n=1 Tax=Bacillus sp. 03113 TaxID=2578211 RepID=UPI0015E8DB90|nr:fluoride efflux transporter CrcB [Bacillus sp. 03113]
MSTYVYIGLGGIVGSLLRFLVSTLCVLLWGNQFPIGTLIVNLIGAFILGWLTKGVFSRKSFDPRMSAAIGTGIIGSFTTLSTLSMDMIKLVDQGFFQKAVFYMFISLFGGLLAASSGYFLGEKQLERANEHDRA